MEYGVKQRVYDKAVSAAIVRECARGRMRWSCLHQEEPVA